MAINFFMMRNIMIITIDGPAGSGKSTISKKLAQILNFEVLDTGAMYRAVAYLLKQKDDPFHYIEDFLDTLKIQFKNNRISANHIDVTDYIRTPEIDLFTSQVISVNPIIRKKMCFLQRKVAQNLNIVTEGRDMGSNVFPNAEFKFYLDANSKVRAKRRYEELILNNIHQSLKECEKEIILRDQEDASRKYNPLCIPNEAHIIDTSDLSIDEVLQHMMKIIQK